MLATGECLPSAICPATTGIIEFTHGWRVALHFDWPSNMRGVVFKELLTLEVPINKAGQVSYTQSLHALALRAFGTEYVRETQAVLACGAVVRLTRVTGSCVCRGSAPTDLNNHRLLAERLDELAPHMTVFNTAQLFGALFVQRWFRRKKGREAMATLAAARDARASLTSNHNDAHTTETGSGGSTDVSTRAATSGDLPTVPERPQASVPASSSVLPSHETPAAVAAGTGATADGSRAAGVTGNTEGQRAEAGDGSRDLDTVV